MLKLTLDSGRSELPNQIIFNETPKLCCSTKIDLCFRIDEDFRRILKIRIKEFLEKYPNCEGPNSRSLFILELESQIMKNTGFLENVTLMERVCFLSRDLTPLDLVCPVCGEKKRFLSYVKGYSNGCCHNHANSVSSSVLAPIVGPKISAALKTRTPGQCKIIAQKAQKTFEKNHPGVTRSDILKQSYLENPELRKQIGLKHSEWMKKNPEKVKMASLKAAEKMKSNVDENGNNHYDRIHLKKLEIGDDGLNFYQRQALKNKVKDENGRDHYDRFRLKMESEGKWIKISELPDYKQYRWWCWHFTNLNDLSLLENYEKRGKHYKGKNEDVFSLDHIYSIAEGFKNNIPPYIIGSIHNLRFLRWDENLSKKDRCDITIEDLLSRIQDNK